MNKLNFFIALMSTATFAQIDDELMLAPNTAGFCDADALLTKINNQPYAIAFEGEQCLQPEKQWATATINGKIVNAWILDRTAGATLYYLDTREGLKDELCDSGEIQGATINTPLGIMTLASRTETFIRSNGCVVAMKASEGLYINAAEIRMFASPMLQAFYRISTRCGATNVCGVGLVTAAHCVMDKAYSDTIPLWDRIGNSIEIYRAQAKTVNAKEDYAIFPQREGHCIPPVSGKLAQGEMVYIPTFGKAGAKIVTSAYRSIDGDGDMEVERATISQGDSGTGAVTRKGEFAGVVIKTKNTVAHMRGMEQMRDVSDPIKVK
jgi:hypothetical protein